MLADLLSRLERLEDQMRHIVRCGTVTATDPETAKVRVQFADADRMVSYDLPVRFEKTQDDKDYDMPDIGEQVVCLFLPFGVEQGFVLGAVYSQADEVPVISQNKKHRLFADGTWFEYDREKHFLSGKNVGSKDITTALDSEETVMCRDQRGSGGGRVNWAAGSQNIIDPAAPSGPVGPMTDATIGSALLIKPLRAGVGVDGLENGAAGLGVHVFIDDAAKTINIRPGNWKYAISPGEAAGTWSRDGSVAPAVNLFAEQSPALNLFCPVITMAKSVDLQPCVLNIIGNVNHTGDTTQQGNLVQTGNIESTGTIIDGAGNTPNHSHG